MKIKDFNHLVGVCKSDSIYSFSSEIEVSNLNEEVYFLPKVSNMITQRLLSDVVCVASKYYNFRFYVKNRVSDGRLCLVCYALF